jgi:hypothetical protein
MTPAELRAALDALGLSERQAARRLRIGEQSLHEWLSGSRVIPGPVAQLVQTWQRYDVDAPPDGVGDDRDREAHRVLSPVAAALIEDAVRAGWSEPEAVMAILQAVVGRLIDGIGHSAAMAAMQETIGLVRRELH